MVKNIVHDPFFLRRVSAPASAPDIKTADDLADTLRANAAGCVGMAANMIGVSKRIIVFFDSGRIVEMFNPVITGKSGEYETEEGCLSLSGTRKTKRYGKITVTWQDRSFKTHKGSFSGFTAQIIQHEIDHCDGVLI